MVPQELRAVHTPAAPVVAPHRPGHLFGVRAAFDGEVVEQERREVVQRDAVRLPETCEQRFAQLHEPRERGAPAGPEQGGGLDEVAAVGDEVPVAAEPPDALHRGEVDVIRPQHLVRRVRAVDHAPLGVVADDRRAAQPLEDADLDLLRAERDEPVEPGGEAGEVLARQAGDQVGVDVYARLAPEEPQVLREFRVVLPAADSGGDVVVERLYAHLELQRPGREPADWLPQRLGQPVGDHLEVQEQPRPVPVEEELEDRPAGVEVQVERAVHELEPCDAPVEQAAHLAQERLERDVSDRHVERGQAELAPERAAPGRLDVDHAIGDVLVVVEGIRQHQPGRVGQLPRHDLHQRPRPAALARAAAEERFAEARERDVRLAGHDVVRQRDDLLAVRLVADLRPAQHDDDVRPQPLEVRDELQRLRRVPDVHPDADHPRPRRQDRLQHVERPLVDVELHDPRPLPQRPEVGHQVPQAERGVGVLGVQRGEDEVGHGASVALDGRHFMLQCGRETTWLKP